MAAIISFAVSFLGLAALLGFKLWELSSGRSFVENLRRRGDELVSRSRHAVLHKLPQKMQAAAVSLHREHRHVVSALVGKARALLTRSLERLLDAVKGRSLPERRASVSFFLRNVSEHKNDLRASAPPTIKDNE